MVYLLLQFTRNRRILQTSNGKLLFLFMNFCINHAYIKQYIFAFCSSFSTALTFTCVWYCAIVTSGMSYILLLQLLNISYNMTEREARIALRENIGRRLLWGMIVDTGQYNRGFLHNWIQFFTLRSSNLQQTAEEDVV
uniref:Uncharacterized protein n=1 Tax=Micrurus lemniscatus lemniscatus TaxID=129467 RepID=A0A2D4JG07_MICLE